MPTAKVTKAKVEEAPKEEHLMKTQPAGNLRTHLTAIAPANWTPESVLRAHGLWMY